MSRSISWIDPRRFDALLGRARGQAAAVDVAVPRAWEVAEAAKLPRPPLSPSPTNTPVPVRAQVNAPLRARRDTPPQLDATATSETGVDTSKTTRKTLFPYRPPPGGLDARAKALLDWLVRKLGSKACFVADEHGLALVERNANMEYLAATAALVAALEDVRRMMPVDRGSMSILLGEEKLLCCVVEDTDWGRLAVGLVQEDKLSEAQMGIVANALRATFTKENNA